jgi:hypothetical protein
MKLSERIDAFARLGNVLHSIEEAERNILYRQALNYNAWFTPKQCDLALTGVSKFLVKDKLARWAGSYDLSENQRKVGVVMAGNIPLVGFHDLLCVLISGHRLAAKLSSQDSVLMRYVVEQLVKIEPRFREQMSFVERMNDAGAVIATGSDNTARYFEYYFRNIPHIIRKNRSSCAVLSGDETDEQLIALGKDVFSYFGLGCRNVSKLFVPEGYHFTRLLSLWQRYEDVFNHHKYVNNYDYNKSILLVNRTPHLDNGFVLLTEGEALVSPISVVYSEYGRPDPNSEKIQCIVGSGNSYVPFGKTQEPELTDYADRVDTLKFLTAL